MNPVTDPSVQIRDATEIDIPALAAIKGTGSEAVHSDRLRDAQDSAFRYLVLLVDGSIIGFACLVSRRPPHWSDAGDVEHLPQIVDLQVKESHRGQGYGSAFIHALEQMATQADHDRLYILVEPRTNPRAYALYQRLGYQPLQQEPYQKAWQFVDSEGKVHCGINWVIDVVKRLSR